MSWCSTCLQESPTEPPATCPHSQARGLRQHPGLCAVRPPHHLPSHSLWHGNRGCSWCGRSALSGTQCCLGPWTARGTPQIPWYPMRADCLRSGPGPAATTTPAVYQCSNTNEVHRNWGQQPQCGPARGLPTSPMTRGVPPTVSLTPDSGIRHSVLAPETNGI